MMKNRIAEKLELIDRIAESEKFDLLGLPTGLLVHSVLNSIPLKELIRIFHYESTGDRWVSGNICKRLPNDADRKLHYDYLFEALKDASYVNRLRIRKLMDTVIFALSETRKMEYFSYFFRSDYLYERKAALKLAESFWTEDIQSIVLSRYELGREEEILTALIRKLDIDLLIELLKTAYPVLPRYLRGIVVNRFKEYPLKKPDFLREADPSNYLRLAALTGGKVDDSPAADCYFRVAEKERPFALYNLGLLGKWDFIKLQIEDYLEDPANAFPGFSELIFEH